MLGDRYCINPMVDKGTHLAACANNKRGMAVTTPERTSKITTFKGKAINELVPSTCLG